MKQERKCQIESCSNAFTVRVKSNRKYCSRECVNKSKIGLLIGDKNPMRRPEIAKLNRERQPNKKGKPNPKLSIALKNSEKAKALQFKKGKENPAFGKNQTREANNNWKGGKVAPNQKLRNSPEYKVWRQTCMERDGFKCTECGAKGYLQVHHIKELAKHIELALEIENGKTVCLACHWKIHGRQFPKYKKKNE